MVTWKYHCAAGGHNSGHKCLHLLRRPGDHAHMIRPGLLLLGSCCALTIGCAVHDDRGHEWIRRHAAQDLGCPMGQLTVHHNTATPKRKVVEGCGKQVVYVEVCPPRAPCDWAREAEAAPATPGR